MASEAVVIGGGPGAVRAAAALARQGRSVVLLQEGPFAGGFADTDVPVGRGVSPRPSPLADAIVGPMRAVEGYSRAILKDRKVRALPLHRSAIPALLPMARVAPAAVAWARTRGTIELKKLIGGGNEQRSYRDWVSQRFGEPAFEALHAPYCRKRFGEPDTLSCSVARVFHGTVEAEGAWAPEGGSRVVAPDALTGVDVRTNVAIRAVRGGEVETDDGTFAGVVFADVPPARLLGWLEGTFSEAFRFDTAQLHARDAVQVVLRCATDLPAETHVIDADVPFYRIVRPELLPGNERLAGTVVVHFVAAPDDTTSDTEWISRAVEGLAAAGISGAERDGARVQRIPWQHPVWEGTHLVRMRTYVLALEELEITPVGRGGLHNPLTLAEELAYLEAAIAESRPSLRELIRAHVDPTVLDPAERAHLSRFVER